jgi:hypothetical protein
MPSRGGQCLPSAPSLRTNEIYMDMDLARILQAFDCFLLDSKGSMCDLKVVCQTTQRGKDAMVVAQPGGVQPDKWTKVLVRENRRTCWCVT